MDGQDSVPACYTGAERGSCLGTCGIDSCAGTCILFGYLSAWSDAGYHFMDKREKKKKQYRFSYSPEKKVLRYGMLGVFVVALLSGVGSLAALLAPYSSYGRIVQNLLSPVYQWGNNLLACFAERMDSYAFYETDVWMRSLPTFVIAAITFILLAILAWRNGRTYCNTICPVGTVLGFLSRFSLFRITIDESKCNACGLCSRKCKAACIDGKEHRVDYSRCVACMDCIDTCRHQAITYRWVRKNEKMWKLERTIG